MVGPDGLQHLVGGGDDQIAADDEIGAPRAGADRVDVVRVRATRMWQATAPPFCARPDMSMVPKPLPSICAAWPRTARDRDDAGATDAGDHHGVGLVQRGALGSGRLDEQRGEPLAPASPSGASALAPCTVTKLGQKPFRQEKSLLQADWSMARLRPNSVSSGTMATQFDLHAAVAAAFADGFVDEDALVRIGKGAALAAAALLGRAGLVVDERRDAVRPAQVVLHRLQIVAVRDRRPGGSKACRILLRLVGDDGDASRRLRPAPAAPSAPTVMSPSSDWPPVMATASL